MTIQELRARIDHIEEVTKKIVEENPGCQEVHWQIEGIPYDVFVEATCMTKAEPFQLAATDRMALNFYPAFNPCRLFLISVPVTIKTFFEEKK